MSDAEKLIELAKGRFEDFGEADGILFTAVAAGKLADYTEGKDKDKIENAGSWTERRIIRADRIEWLCRDRQAKELVTDKGIQAKGAKIEGEVDLSFAEILFPLNFYRCVFKEKINLMHSKIKALGLNGSYTRSIKADGVRVERYVFLRDGFRAEGEVSFLRAAIGGNLDCINGKFINKDGRAISADKIDLEGNVFLRDGFRAEGEVSFLRAVIGGDFDCEKGEFINEKGNAISADGIDVKGYVFLRDGFSAEGEIRFLRATIKGEFNCKNGKFINEDDKAISADGIGVRCGVFLSDGFRAKGEVRFLGATIGGNFDCVKGEFINEDNKAISADQIDVKGSVFLRDGFKAEGEVRFLGAAIDGDFDCEKGEFINKKGDAISAEGMDVKGSAYLRNGFKAEGRASFIGAVVGSFVWTSVNHPEKTILDLQNAKAGVLWDNEKSWPKKGNLFLDGFVYENIYDEAPKDAKSRIEWLNRQGEERFRSGPYEQLARVLNKIGHSEDAKKILIEKEKKITRLGGFGLWRKLWRGVLGVTIGYGYRPWRALWFIGAFILIGFIVFGSGYKAGFIVPAEKEAYVSRQLEQLREGYPKFNAFVYSIEMFVPVVDLHMAKYWRPDANKSEMLSFKKWSFRIRGDFIRVYMWVHICAGWILTTLWVVGLTGLVKK